MPIFRMILLLALMLFRPLSIEAGTHYIPLGRDCQPTWAITNFNLRAAAYPMDWMVSHHFNGVIDCIQSDFKYFLNPAFLIYKTYSIENTYYKFGYNHFFPLVGLPVTEEVHVAGTVVSNYLDYLPFVQEVQNRRIKRLQDLLSSSERIVFVRTHSTPKEAADFMNMIKHKYPKSEVFLVVVHERTDLIGDWNLPNVLNFYASQRNGFADWWAIEEWIQILSYLQHWFAGSPGS